MDEKFLEQIQFHTDTVEADANSPLHLIREKEMEISGQVLSAKKEAEEIVAEARRAAVDALAKAEAEGEAKAAEQETRVLAEAKEQLEQVGKDNELEIEELRKAVSGRMDTAVEFVVKTVTGA